MFVHRRLWPFALSVFVLCTVLAQAAGGNTDAGVPGTPGVGVQGWNAGVPGTPGVGVRGWNASYAYQATVAEVHLSFVATDGHNRDIDDLKLGDFLLVDNQSIIRNFRSFTRSAEINLEMVVLLDSSGSASPVLQQEIGSVRQLITNANWGAADRISVLSVSGVHPSFVCTDDCRTADAANRLSRMRAGGLTPLFDAVVAGVNFVSQQSDPQLRRVFIIFSDGEDNISAHTAQDAIQAAQQADAQIYTVDLNKEKDGTGSFTLQRMAHATGGRSFSIRHGAPQALASVLEDLRNAYVVTYTPPSRIEGAHSLRLVPTHDLNLRLRCREAYYLKTP